MLVNITNDAWFKDSTAPYQHAQASVFRAVENRVPVIRAANTGLSCFINTNGEIIDSVSDGGKEILVTGLKTADVTLDYEPTFYTERGDVFALSLLILWLLTLKPYLHRLEVHPARDYSD